MDADFIGEIAKLEEHEKLTKLVLMRTQMDVVLDLIYAWENSKYSSSDLVDTIKEKLDPEHTWKPLDENDKPLTNAELEEIRKEYGLE